MLPSDLLPPQPLSSIFEQKLLIERTAVSYFWVTVRDKTLNNHSTKTSNEPIRRGKIILKQNKTAVNKWDTLKNKSFHQLWQVDSATIRSFLTQNFRGLVNPSPCPYLDHIPAHSVRESISGLVSIKLICSLNLNIKSENPLQDMSELEPFLNSHPL